jgi:5-methylcytosine-specific restriction protein A
MIETEMDFPYIVGEYYSAHSIRKKYHTGGTQGINPKKDLIIVFMSAHAPRKDYGLRKKFQFRNVYHDSYNDSLGAYLYTGTGQKGDQTLTKGRNKSLANAKENGQKIHLFRQHNPKSTHEYIGEVEVTRIQNDIQKDSDDKERKVIIFHLTPISPTSGNTSYDDAISREIESDISTKPTKTSEQIEKELKKINEKILKEGPKKGQIANRRTKSQLLRNQQIVTLLKLKHTKCMICQVSHFEKISGALYSDGCHIIRWATSHNDSSENIIILCPTCHSKFDHAKITERQKMYKKLTDNFPNTKFEKPEWM